MKIKIAQFGLGPIGQETLKLAATRSWAEIVGAIDIDPAKIGRKLNEVVGTENTSDAWVYGSFSDLYTVVKPDVVFHTAVSKFKDALPQIESMVRHGITVVSSCEELVFPQLREPVLSAKLDELCREADARVVGTGVNPGFVMDLLPSCLTGISQTVKTVHVRRVVDATSRRGPLQKKIGSGLAPETFTRLFKEGKMGHAGLQESLALIAHCLGWKLSRIQEIAEPVLADTEIRTPYVQVQSGQTRGLHQRAEGEKDGRVCLTLDLKMYLNASNPHDGIQIDGVPPLDLVIQGGVAGDQATVAALVNIVPRVLNAPPGLRLINELPLPSLA
jgi:4-hydroxy-tetrahydrodipicolinate reductase